MTTAVYPNLEWKELLVGELRQRILSSPAIQALNLDVHVGWAGNEPTGKPRPALILEAGQGESLETTPEIMGDGPSLLDTGALAPVAAGDGVYHGEGIDQVNGTGTADYGMAEFPINCTLIVRDAKRGRTVRSEILRALDRLFGPTPGLARQIAMELPNGLGTVARVFPDDGGPRAEDSPEGMQKDEWIARWTWTAQHALEAEVETLVNTSIVVQPEYDEKPYPEFPVEAY